MIWSSDAAGTLTYMCPEWNAYTGMQATAVLQAGWKSAVHDDERQEVDVFFAEALTRRSEFCIMFRLRLASGDHVWVRAGAVPSVSMADREFIGYLGTITELQDQDVVPEAAFAEFGNCNETGGGPKTEVRSVMDLIADHVLLSHSLAVKVGDQAVQEALEVSLVSVGRALAQAAMLAV